MDPLTTRLITHQDRDYLAAGDGSVFEVWLGADFIGWARRGDLPSTPAHIGRVDLIDALSRKLFGRN